jgi:hypothetical protein
LSVEKWLYMTGRGACREAGKLSNRLRALEWRVGGTGAVAVCATKMHRCWVRVWKEGRMQGEAWRGFAAIQAATEGWHLPCRQAELVVRQGLADGRIAALRIDGLLVALTTDIGRVGGHMLSSGGLQSWQLAAVTSSCTLSAGLVQAAWNTYRSQGQAGPGCLLQLPTVCGFVLCVQVWSD